MASTEAVEPTPIKLHLFGEGAVGKTCFLFRASSNTFPHEYIPTVFDNYTMDVDLGKKKVSLGLWDYSSRDGEDRWLRITIVQTDVIMLCYSVIRSTDLQYMVQRWVPQFGQHAPGVPILLVGMKEDLRNDPKYKTGVVTFEAAEKIAKELGAVGHMTCSSLTGDGVQAVVEKAISFGLKYHSRPTGSQRKVSRCVIC